MIRKRRNSHFQLVRMAFVIVVVAVCVSLWSVPRARTAIPNRLVKDKTNVSAERLLVEAEQLRSDWNAASWRKAVVKYKSALELVRRSGDKQKELLILKTLGSLYFSLNDAQRALSYYDAAQLLTRLNEGSKSLSEILAESGYVYFSRGEVKRAQEVATTALELARESASPADEARALDLLGETFLDSGNIRKALASYQGALAIWKRINDRQGQTLALLHSGYAYSDLGESDQATKAYDASLTLARSTNNKRHEGWILAALGHLYSKTGNKQKAFDSYFKAREILEPIEAKVALASIFNGLGFVFEELGQTKSALDNYSLALSLFQTMGHRFGEAGSLHKIGKSHFALGNKNGALKAAESSRAVSKAIGAQRMEAVATALIGQVYASIGKEKLALEYFDQALALNVSGDDRREQAYTLNAIGVVLERMGNLGQAFATFDRALLLNRETKDRLGQSATLANISHLLRAQRKFDDARAYIEAAIRMTESVRADVAGQEFRASFVASVHQQYELYVDILMQLDKEQPNRGWSAAAFEASERGRARSLLETIGESRADLRSGVDPQLIERERVLQNELDVLAERQLGAQARNYSRSQREALENEIQKLTEVYEQLHNQIRASARRSERSETLPLTLSEIHQMLDPGTVIIEYALGAERSYAWVVTPVEINSFELARRDEIERVSRLLYESIIARNVELDGETVLQAEKRISAADREVAVNALALSELLITPALPALQNKRIIVIADGVLQYIPFGMLPVPGDPGRALIVDHEVVSLPSASVLAAQRRQASVRPKATLGLALFADPVFDTTDERVRNSRSELRRPTPNAQRGRSRTVEPSRTAYAQSQMHQALRDVRVGPNGTLPRLIFSRAEALAVLELEKGSQPLSALGFDATRERVLDENLSKYRYIHFATHGLLNSEHPQLSGIILSMVDRNGRPQNGFLKLTEIYDLNLTADLVVLSACQTGLGKNVRGEGLIGLTRGFMYAGAQRVVASLWKVDDSATAALMTQFYKEMFLNKRRPAEALKEAQVSISQQKRWRSPYYWAGFVLQGEWR